MKTRTIDTNILVRLLARDDSAQWKIAANLLTVSRVAILSTVLLEAEWVLRKSIGLRPEQIAGLFRAMMASEAIVFAEPDRVKRALDAFEVGMDFADALHISGPEEGDSFITFDRDLVKRANEHIQHVSVELAS